MCLEYFGVLNFKVSYLQNYLSDCYEIHIGYVMGGTEVVY